MAVGDVGLSIQATHLQQTRWAKRIKMDLVVWLNRRATSMSPCLWHKEAEEMERNSPKQQRNN